MLNHLGFRCLCVEFGLCKSIVAEVEKSEPSEVPLSSWTDILLIWPFILFLKYQISIHAKIEPAITIIDSKTHRILKNEWKIFLGHPYGIKCIFSTLFLFFFRYFWLEVPKKKTFKKMKKKNNFLTPCLLMIISKIIFFNFLFFIVPQV